MKAAGMFSIASLWTDDVLEALPQNTRTDSKPSELKITDMRVATVVRTPGTSTLIRLDTNQGIYGLGEVRDGASATYALMLKSRLVGENPCNVEKIFSQDQAVWRRVASGRWGLRCRDGAVGSGRQSI